MRLTVNEKYWLAHLYSHHLDKCEQSKNNVMDHFVFGCLLQCGDKMKRLFFYLDESQFWLAATEPAVTFISLCDQALQMKRANSLMLRLSRDLCPASKCCRDFLGDLQAQLCMHDSQCSLPDNSPSGRESCQEKNKQASKWKALEQKPNLEKVPILPLQLCHEPISDQNFWVCFFGCCHFIVLYRDQDERSFHSAY